MWYYSEFLNKILKCCEIDKFAKFENFLNPKLTQNLKSLTLVTKAPISQPKMLKSQTFWRKFLKPPYWALLAGWRMADSGACCPWESPHDIAAPSYRYFPSNSHAPYLCLFLSPYPYLYLSPCPYPYLGRDRRAGARGCASGCTPAANSCHNRGDGHNRDRAAASARLPWAGAALVASRFAHFARRWGST